MPATMISWEWGHQLRRESGHVAIGDERPMAGSRRHYSLVDGGKWQEEEMQKQKVTFADLQEEVLP